MIIVSSCGIKIQEVLSGLEKKAKTLDIHMHFCGFSQHSFIHSFIHYFIIFFLSTWGVINDDGIWVHTWLYIAFKTMPNVL